MLSAQALGMTAVAMAMLGLVVLVSSLALAGPDWVTAAAVSLSFLNAGVLVALAGGPPAASILPYVALVLPAAYQIVVRRAPVVWGWPMTAMLAFVVIALVSTVFSARPGDSIGTIAEWMLEGLAFFFALTNSIRSTNALRRCLQGIVVAGAIVGLAVAYQHHQGNFYNTYFGLAQVSDPYDITSSTSSVLSDGEASGQFRAAGMIGEPNFFAMIMAALTPWAVYLALTTTSRFRRLLWLGAFLLIVFAVFVSYSRGALLAAGTVLALMALWGVMPRKTLVYLFGGAGVAVLTVPSLAERLATLSGIVASGGGGEASSAGRLSEVGAAWDVFATHPLLGVGPGQFPLYYQRYLSQTGGGVHSGEGARNAHNIVLGVAADVGLVGLVGFALLIGVIVAGLVRVRRSRQFYALSTTALISISLYLACSAFLHLAYARYLWLLLALSASLISLAGQSTDQPSPKPRRQSLLSTR